MDEESPIKQVAPERFQEALDVMFGQGSDEEIETWFATQPDGELLAAALLDGFRVQDPAERKAARMQQ